MCFCFLCFWGFEFLRVFLVYVRLLSVNCIQTSEVSYRCSLESNAVKVLLAEEKTVSGRSRKKFVSTAFFSNPPRILE